MNCFKLLIFLTFSSLCLNAKTLNVGSEAPIFSLTDENGEKWHSGDFLNKKNILIFFYPAAMTGGCTKQACAYRDDLVEWKSRDFEIVGISGDKSANLKLFKRAENLNFKLLSDLNGEVARSFGVPQTKEVLFKSLSKGKDSPFREEQSTKDGPHISKRRNHL